MAITGASTGPNSDEILSPAPGVRPGSDGGPGTAAPSWRSWRPWIRYRPGDVRGLMDRVSAAQASVIGVLLALAGLHVGIALLHLFGTASGEAAGWRSLPIDESWTRMAYVRNFADSFRFEFIPGEAATGATSPLWIALNGLMAALFGIEDADLPVLAGVLGLLFGMASISMTLFLARQVTRRRFFGVLGAATLAVEPHFAFAAVSGTEVTMFSAFALAASWAFLRGRIRTAGALTALTVAARPEGVLLAALVLGATLARWMWRRQGPFLQRRRDLHDVAYLAGPTAILVLAWIAHNWAVSGAPLPDSYLATRDSKGLLPLSNLWNTWLGYLHELPFMEGLAWFVGLPLILLGMYSLLRRNAFAAAPLTLFSVALVYAAIFSSSRPAEAWAFEDRRHMDPVMPFIVVMLTAGTARSFQLVQSWKRARRPLSERERKAVAITARVAATALVLAPLVALPFKVNSLSIEYSWRARNTGDVQVAMGRWLAENTPRDAVIGALPAGAINFMAGGPGEDGSSRRVLDLSGKNLHDVIGRPGIPYGIESGVDYLVASREPYFDSLTGRDVVNEERVRAANPFDTNVLRAYGPEGSRSETLLPAEAFASFDQAGLAVIDTLDVANRFAPDEVSETTHNYLSEGERRVARDSVSVGENQRLEDAARVFGGSEAAEEFFVASVPGVPLTVVRRHDATVAHRLRVLVDGQDAGIWELPVARTFLAETPFTIPPELVTERRTHLRFELIRNPGASATASYFYWILVPREHTRLVP